MLLVFPAQLLSVRSTQNFLWKIQIGWSINAKNFSIVSICIFTFFVTLLQLPSARYSAFNEKLLANANVLILPQWEICSHTRSDCCNFIIIVRHSGPERKNAAISKQNSPCTRKCWLALIPPLLLVLPAIRLNHKKFLTHITLLINLRALPRHKRNASQISESTLRFEINDVWVTHSSAS